LSSFCWGGLLGGGFFGLDGPVAYDDVGFGVGWVGGEFGGLLFLEGGNAVVFGDEFGVVVFEELVEAFNGL
jgi:hypothetical protein